MRFVNMNVVLVMLAIACFFCTSAMAHATSGSKPIAETEHAHRSIQFPDISQSVSRHVFNNGLHAFHPRADNSPVWIRQKVTGGKYDGRFGQAVAIDGSTAFVGAPYAQVGPNDPDPASGVVYVFTESDGVWHQTQIFHASDYRAWDPLFFGRVIALEDKTAVIGTGTNVAYIFTKSNGEWHQSQELSVKYPAGNGFGRSVALEGNTAFIGAKQGSVAGSGAVFVFHRSNGAWTQVQKLTAGNKTQALWFGGAIALGDGIALIADVRKNKTYVFVKSNGSWVQTQVLTASDGNGDDNGFGQSIVMEGNLALIGAPGADVSQGAAYVFVKSNGVWIQRQKLTASDGAWGDDFGSSVALYDGIAFIGAPSATVEGNDAQGAVYVFAESNGTWAQVRKLTQEGDSLGNYFGFSVALNASTGLVGKPLPNVEHGQAFFYGRGNVGLAVSAPHSVERGNTFVSQVIVTNKASSSSPAIAVSVPVFQAADFVSVEASQGGCSKASNVVTCNFGAINGNAGTATASIRLKATGEAGNSIKFFSKS